MHAASGSFLPAKFEFRRAEMNCLRERRIHEACVLSITTDFLRKSFSFFFVLTKKRKSKILSVIKRYVVLSFSPHWKNHVWLIRQCRIDPPALISFFVQCGGS